MAGKSSVPVKTNPLCLGENRSISISTNTLNTCTEVKTKKGPSSRGNAPQDAGETPLHGSQSPGPYIRNCTHSVQRGSDHPKSSLIVCKQRSPDTFSRRLELSTMNDSQSPKMWLQTNKFNTRHSRSYSFRTMRRPTPQQLAEEEQFRPRGATMPSDSRSYLREKRRQRLRERASPSWSPLDHLEDVDEHFYRLRNFSTTSKGEVINRGDQFRQWSRSSNSVASSYTYPSCISTDTSCSFDQEGRCTHLKVLVLGAVGVGKSSIVTQFMSSEYMNTYNVSQDDELEKTIFLLLDGEEFELTLSDHHTLTTLTVMYYYIRLTTVIGRTHARGLEGRLDIILL
ncbi:uncharacterized protein LOC143232412 [Tachypleus tridentatus]|uniref:uncharacterized protein LOC143232412 n=1 Tax=Tachypleus tridentatus TaxID=6853 RepID=UPI003FD4CB2E